MIDADHFVRGEGIAWMRRYLAKTRSSRSPSPHRVRIWHTHYGFACRSKGVNAATIIPSVGCPMGCNFCTTSAFFVQGKFLNFYETGDECIAS